MGIRTRIFLLSSRYRQLSNMLPVLFILLTTCFPLPQTAALFYKAKLKKLAKYGIIGAALLPRYIPIGVPVHHGYGGVYDLGGHTDYGIYGGTGGLGGHYEVLGGTYGDLGGFGGYGFW